MNNKKATTNRWLILLVLSLLCLLSLNGMRDKEAEPPYVSFSDFMGKVSQKTVTSVSIDGEDLTFTDLEDKESRTIRPVGEDIVKDLVSAGIKVDVVSQTPSLLVQILVTLLPMILMIGIFIWLMRGMRGGMMGLGKSKARLITDNQGKITFADVAGVDEAKGELQEVVSFLKSPGKYSALGGKIPRGVLLIGPPGTGKTLLARSVAGEAGVPFYSISGSDFVEMFVGVGAKRVREMFAEAKKSSPCIIFIDEIDAVGRARGVGVGGGSDEREQTLNQLLVEMDGFSENEGIIIIAATNRKDVLDPALLRPGRFDRQVFVGNPDLRGRERILTVHARKVPLSVDADLSIIARGTPGFSGADLMNLMNEAALLAANRDHERVTMRDLEDAKDKVLMGVERREMFISPEQKEKTAWHEAGHAIVGMALPKCDPVYKATIIPRGGALGMVVSLPEMDRFNYHKDELEQKIAMTMAGKAAEVMIYGENGVSNGPAGDIQQASQLARAMVMRWGMSDKVGPVDYSEAHEGYSGGTPGFSVSAETKALIESEVRRIIEEGYKKACRVLTKNRVAFENLAQGLLKYETLSGEEIKRVIRGLPPRDEIPEIVPGLQTAVNGHAKAPVRVPVPVMVADSRMKD